MDKRFARWVIAMVVSTTASLSSTAIANATVTGHQLVRVTFEEEFLDVGCKEQVVVHLDGTRVIREVDVNGGIRTGVIEHGTASFAEAGETFAGSFTRTFSISLPADQAVVVTQEYTVALHDDAGDTATLHITAHATVLANGNVTTSYAILHHACTAA